MKVLTVNTVRFLTNGITSVILNYFRNIDKTDLQMDFVVNREISDDYLNELTEAGSEIYNLPRNKNPLLYMYKLYKILKKEKYDIVHIHGNSAMMFLDVFPAFLAKTPVRIVHSHNTTCTHMKVHKLLKGFFDKCYTHGFACGELAGEWLFGDNNFEVLKNGIELDKYAFDAKKREEYRQRLDAGDNKVIGHAGNYNPQKNHDFMLDIFAELLKKDEKYLLVLFGEGDLLEAMQQKAKELGIDHKVKFMGKTSEMSGFMQAMDIFLLPSLFEGLPVTLVEAQSAGIPCLVSENVSSEANLTGELKYYPLDSAEAWADRLIDTKVLEDRTEQSRLWQIKIAECGYDIKKSAQKMKELYISYCGK